VEMKNRIQAQRLAECEARRGEFGSYIDLVNARVKNFGLAGVASNHILLIVLLAALALIVLPSCSNKRRNGGLADRVIDQVSASSSDVKPIGKGQSGETPKTAPPATVPTTSTTLPPSDDGSGVVIGLGAPPERDDSYFSDPDGQANSVDPGTTSTVPEPATILLFLSAGSLAVCLRRHKPG
jgi:hypothetical protein